VAGVVKAGGEGVGARCKDESMAEVNLGRDRKKMFGWKGDTLRPEALKCAEGAVCGRVVHAAVVRSGVERSWSCAAVNRSTTTIAPPHLGQRHSDCAVGGVDVSDSLFGGVAWRVAKHRGSMVARFRLARKPKWRMRTKPLGSR